MAFQPSKPSKSHRPAQTAKGHNAPKPTIANKAHVDGQTHKTPRPHKTPSRTNHSQTPKPVEHAQPVEPVKNPIAPKPVVLDQHAQPGSHDQPAQHAQTPQVPKPVEPYKTAKPYKTPVLFKHYMTPQCTAIEIQVTLGAETVGTRYMSINFHSLGGNAPVGLGSGVTWSDDYHPLGAGTGQALDTPFDYSAPSGVDFTITAHVESSGMVNGPEATLTVSP